MWPFALPCRLQSSRQPSSIRKDPLGVPSRSWRRALRIACHLLFTTFRRLELLDLVGRFLHVFDGFGVQLVHGGLAFTPGVVAGTLFPDGNFFDALAIIGCHG